MVKSRSERRERVAKRKDRLAEAAFSSRENSSNGSEAVKTFLQKYYEGTGGSVKKFLEDKCLYFQQLAKLLVRRGK